MKPDQTAAIVEIGYDGRTEVRTEPGVNAVQFAGILRAIAYRLDPEQQADHVSHRMVGAEMASEEEAASIQTADDMVRRLESSTGVERVQQALTRGLACHRPSGNYNVLGCTCGSFEDIEVKADDEPAMLAAAELFEIHQAHAVTLYILGDIDAYARAKGLEVDVAPRTRPDGTPL